MKNELAAILLVVGIMAGAGCRKAETSQKLPSFASGDRTGSSLKTGEIVLPPDSPLLSQIRIEAVRAAELPESEVSAPGRVEFDVGRISRIHLPVPGRVERVFVRIGDAVTPGQAMLTIDSPDADAAVSAYRQAQAAIMQAKSTLAKATADRDRTVDLYDHKAAAKKEVLAAENELTMAQAAVDQAEATRDQAKRRLDLLGLNEKEGSSRITIVSPMAGKVIESAVTAGEYHNDTTTPVMTVADLSVVWVTSDIPETSIRLIDVGERIKVELIAYPGEVFDARVTRIADSVDPKTRTVQVRAELPNPAGRLKPEMFGRIRHMHPAKAVPVVPAKAVYRRGADTMVFVERALGSFERVPVSLGSVHGDLIAVRSGVGTGDRIVVEGVMLLAGMDVR